MTRQTRNVVARLVVVVAIVCGLGAARLHLARRGPDAATTPSPHGEAPAPAKLVDVADAGTITAVPVPAGDLRRHARFDVALYHSKKPTKVVRTILPPSPFKILEKPTGQVPTEPVVVVADAELSAWPAPTLQQLAYNGPGLTEAEKTSLQEAVAVTPFVFVSPNAADLRAAMRVVSEVAGKTDALIWDDSTRLAFSRARWDERREAFDEGIPIASKHVTIHVYRDGNLFRVVTLGMAKFGLPDVSVDQVSGSDSETMGALVNAVCQTLVENPLVSAAGRVAIDIPALKAKRARDEHVILAGAKGQGTVTLAFAKPKDGDADNRLVAIAFPGSADDLNKRQNALLQQIYGAHEAVVGIQNDDAELKAASMRARARVMKEKPRWTNGAPGLEHLLVKAPFATPKGNNEFMWIEVVTWKGKTIEGVLQNDAFEIPGLKTGTKVEVEEESIFDYLLRKADGTTEGNETAAVLEKKGKPR